MLPVALVAVGLITVLSGLLTLLGRNNYWLRWYDNPRLPPFIRGSGLGGLWWGLALVLLGVALLAGRQEVSSGRVAMTSAAFFCLFTLAGLLISWYQPRWAKPAWLRERDEKRPPPPSLIPDKTLLFSATAACAIAALWFLFVAFAVK